MAGRWETNMETIQAGLLGCGTVGTGIVQILRDNASEIEARLSARVAVKRIAVKSLEKARAAVVDRARLTASAAEVVDDPEVAIVVETIGGIEPARTLILRAIANKKHVVTANKALLAEHGEEIFAAARASGVDVYYEAAVGGGIPIIRSLREGLASDRIQSIHAIVNGTTNFILTEMAEQGANYGDTLARAQAAGYAEADPALDVGGGDAAHKLAILVSLAFGWAVKPAEIHTEGITAIDPLDISFARDFGFRVKLLAIAKEDAGRVEVRVHPTLISATHLLAPVNGVFNAILVTSHALGPTMYYGKGAGMMPTGSAVVSDVIELCRNIRLGTSGRLPSRAHHAPSDRTLKPMSDIECRYYLRFEVVDRPGVLARLAGILGDNGVSIAQMLQREQKTDAPVEIVILTHRAREGGIQSALHVWNKNAFALSPGRLIRIED